MACFTVQAIAFLVYFRACVYVCISVILFGLLFFLSPIPRYLWNRWCSVLAIISLPLSRLWLDFLDKRSIGGCYCDTIDLGIKTV